MRPDVNNWRCTNQLSTLHFSPRSILYRRLLGWTLGLLALQLFLGSACWVTLRALMPPAISEAPVIAGNGAKAVLERATTGQSVNDLTDLLLSQMVALLLIHLVAIPVIRRRLSAHVHGMKGLFNAIKDMAAGMTPPPLPTGQRGELGYLSMAFNDMASRLMASRKALVEANQLLEQRVADRTRELSEAASKLDKMASTDVLTGLANRRQYIDQTASRFERSIMHGQDMVCLLVDLDNFKLVNDKLGHKVGDDLLCLAAEVLKAACRGDDLVARLGGDEFIIVMELADVAAAQRIADRIVAEFVRRSREMLAGQNLPAMPSMSIGISSRKTSGAIAFEEVAACSDSALYKAKGQGKGRAEMAEDRRVA